MVVVVVTVQDMESQILHVLRWDLSAVTPHDFLVQITSRLPLDRAHVHTVKKHAQTFMALCATGRHNSQYLCQYMFVSFDFASFFLCYYI